MIKRFRKGLKKQYRIVKKFSTVLEAHLAQEVLTAYHIKAYLAQGYLHTRETFERGMYEVQLLVLPQDYQFAHRLLYATR